MGRHTSSNRQKKGFAAACLAAFTVLAAGSGSMGPSTAAAAADACPPGFPEFALRPSAAPAGAMDAADGCDAPERFTLSPSSAARLELDYVPPDTAPEATATARADERPAVLGFNKGVWDVEISGSHMAPIRHTRDHINAGGVSVGYFVSDGFSLNAGLVGYSIDQPHNYALAGGFDLYARLYVLTLDRFAIYADGGAGVIFSDKAVPHYGTAFNFTPRAGVGISFRLSDNFYLMAGARYWHLSNAGYHGISHNPGYDSVQYYGGVMFTF